MAALVVQFVPPLRQEDDQQQSCVSRHARIVQCLADLLRIMRLRDVHTVNAEALLLALCLPTPSGHSLFQRSVMGDAGDVFISLMEVACEHLERMESAFFVGGVGYALNQLLFSAVQTQLRCACTDRAHGGGTNATITPITIWLTSGVKTDLTAQLGAMFGTFASAGKSVPSLRQSSRHARRAPAPSNMPRHQY
jgi:hypothetical protein